MSSDKQPPSGGGASVSIGSVSGGAFAFGDHGTAESTSTTVMVDRDHGNLLTAVRDLRRELPEGDEVAAQLDEIEGEITRTGSSGRGLLVRLRDRLAENAPATATAAAVTAVVQAVAQILG
ncbi:hypothetical protein [Streptomyces lasiicapitis]|uniref:hypothetical protein n=1 Tax=Streptomyces lasiicapitis TaxID=1923961 RepID=UPI0036BE4C61